ncbi:MAG: hypothetical protein N3F67_05565 [Acidilobaceae archaeon]|nr:hypothetical protein [Acidilobaceae archaeon]
MHAGSLAFSLAAISLVPLLFASAIGAALTLLDFSYHNVSFFLSSLLLSLPTAALAWRLRRTPPLEVRDSFLVISLYWLLLPLLSGIILSSTLRISLLDGFFESLSAMSGAGFTVITPEEAPPVVLLWRSTLQWLGGISVVVIGGAFLPLLHGIIRSLYSVEVGARLAPTVISTVREVFQLYLVLSLLSVTLLLLAGMEPFDALNHGLTGIATAGMSTKDESFTFWYERDQTAVILATMLIMILGATNFADLRALMRGNIRAFIGSPEVRAMAFLLSPLLLISFLSGGESLALSFNAVSALTTTGFQIGDIRSQPDSYKIALIIAMTIGGATFSTAAGLKLKRVIVASKALYMELSRPLLPGGTLRSLRVGGKEYSERDVTAVYAYMFLYAVTLLASSLSLKALLDAHGIEYGYLDVLFEATSALSCVGLSVGIVSPALPDAVKLLLSLIIYLGRIEFLALYLLVGSYYRRRATL